MIKATVSWPHLWKFFAQNSLRAEGGSKLHSSLLIGWLDYQYGTNNAVEVWHWRFQANVGAYHPNFWKFIDILKREQSLNHVNISHARAGHQPEPQRRRYQDSNRWIKNIVQDYHNRDRLQYLRGLAPNISIWRNVFFKNHKTTGFMPPRTVLLRTTNLPWGYANHALLYRPMPYVFYW